MGEVFDLYEKTLSLHRRRGVAGGFAAADSKDFFLGFKRCGALGEHFDGDTLELHLCERRLGDRTAHLVLPDRVRPHLPPILISPSNKSAWRVSKEHTIFA